MKNFKRRALPALLALTLMLGTGAAVATGGGKTDPLVTLSYLTKTVLPNLMDDLDDGVSEVKKELKSDLSDQIDTYEEEMELLVSTGSSGSDAFELVTLSDGQVLAPEVGCELLLRVGSASVISATEPALIDTTTGNTLSNGKSLEKNHLYMVTISDRSLSASGTVKILVRGGYSVM